MDSLGIIGDVMEGGFALLEELRSIINDCLQQIKPLHRALIIEHIVKRYTIKVLAEKYQESQSNLENWIKRSRKRLVECLKHHLSGKDVLMSELQATVSYKFIKHTVYVSLFRDRVEVNHDMDDIPVKLIYNGMEFYSLTSGKALMPEYRCSVFNREVPYKKHKLQASIAEERGQKELIITLYISQV
jgi:hypothetical protein